MRAETDVEHGIGAERRAREVGGRDGRDARAETDVEHGIGAERRARHVDRLIADLAGRQHGVVARRQLTAVGLGRRAIGHRIECGRLHPVYRGVYAVGHRVLSPEAAWMAGVLAAGPRAVLSHRSAAALWGIRTAASSRVDVTVQPAVRSRDALRVHGAHVPDDEKAIQRGIPVTAPPRTLLDLATVLRPAQLERAVEQAEVLRLTHTLSLGDLVDRYPGRRGVRALRRLFDDAALTASLTRSELERRFLTFLQDAGLPRPEVNASLHIDNAWLEADCLWRAARLVAELDGYAAHGTRAAFERDRARDRRLQACGWRVVRVTWRQLHHEPQALARELATLLRPAAPPS